jgi:hypothetical protein
MDAAQQRWREIFTALTQAFLEGDARVLPRDKNVCKACEMKPLCRNNALLEDDDEGGSAGDDAKVSQ